MDKKAIKNFAINARKTLILGITNKLAKLGITETGIEEVSKIDNSLIKILSNGERFTGKDVKSRAKLVEEIRRREKNADYKIAFNTLVEEVAYTWFNRLIAIRFMEVNDYLPGRQRVLSSETAGKKEPDIVTNLLETEIYQNLDTSTKKRVTELLTDGSAEAVDELYQLVFIKVCNSLNQQLPNLFEKIDDYTELLFTISYIDENGVIASLLSIPEEDFDVDKGGQVEIIGWMYQYYNTDPKDKVFARGNRKIRADEIPAATQLFTPDWIVRYMVENSLGRYYIDQKLANPLETRTEKEIAASFGWKYYLPTAEQPEDVQLQIQDERKEKSVFVLQELELLDNAMGSGHVLVYAFDVFIDLYKAEGFGEREAAELIMKNNLYGLEIDKRAYQLAYFAIMMKGRQYNRRILQKNIKLNLYQFENSSNIPAEYFERIEELSPLPSIDFKKALANFKEKISDFEYATEIGSVINLQDWKDSDVEDLRQFINVFDEFSDMDILYSVPETHARLNMILDIMSVMVKKYTAVVTNPPYLNKMSTFLGKYVTDNYKDVKTDLFSVFIKMNSNMLVKGGYAGFMTPFVWMFIKSYEELRTFLITNKSISSLVQMEYSAFEEATVPVCCFTIKNARTEQVGNYFKLSDFRGGMKVQEEKVLEAIQDPSVSYFYQTNQENFHKIPGSPISYWVSENTFNTFATNDKFEDDHQTRAGMITGNNNIFIRLWHEIGNNKLALLNPDRQSASNSHKKWFPYSKGGEFRRWYGNNEFVVNWENDGHYMRTLKDKNGKIPAHAFNLEYIFHSQITWSSLSSGNFAARYCTNGFLFDASGSFAVVSQSEQIDVLAYLNSKVVGYYLSLLNPTLNFQKGNISSLPVIKGSNTEVEKLANENISISKSEWDSFEESWDFKIHPLV